MGPRVVQEFSTSGTPLAKFDEHGEGNGKSNIPWGIATDPTTGNLYVTEIGNNRVQEFSAAGAFITTFGSPGSGNGQLNGPRDWPSAPPAILSRGHRQQPR